MNAYCPREATALRLSKRAAEQSHLDIYVDWMLQRLPTECDWTRLWFAGDFHRISQAIPPRVGNNDARHRDAGRQAGGGHRDGREHPDRSGVGWLALHLPGGKLGNFTRSAFAVQPPFETPGDSAHSETCL